MPSAIMQVLVDFGIIEGCQTIFSSQLFSANDNRNAFDL